MTAEVLPRRALWWLLACHFFVVLPHLTRVPWWLLGVYIGASSWRLQMHRERIKMPAKSIRLLLAIGGMAAIFASYRTLVGLEPMVALLLVAGGFKLVEAVRVRDGYVLVSLGFFVITTQFLFDQSLPAALYGVIGTLLLVTSLVALNTSLHQPLRTLEPLLALKMLTLAVPMMLVLFVVFPRLGPLWSVPSKTGEGTTGMSDHLNPGDVARLSRSADVAFRVQFMGPIPDSTDLYWRGMVLSSLQDGVWRTLDWRDYPASERQLRRPKLGDGVLDYRVISEPTYQQWLFSLPYATSSHEAVVEAWDFRLMAKSALETPFSYRVQSFEPIIIEPQLSPWRRRIELQHPVGLNPRTRAWVDAQRAVYQDDEAFIKQVLATFSQQPFYYTLEPAVITENDFVDRFFFDTRQGFCEHYAYAFVVMMRMAGIPARIIGGYQGGERNPVNNTLIVRQFDAHAWAEVWLDDRGWQRIDPTAAVSPDRIRYGLEQALQSSEGFLADSLLSAYRFRSVSWLNWLRLQYDAAAWRWQSFVIGFDSDQQFELLGGWVGKIDAPALITLTLGSGAMVIMPLTWWLHRSRRGSERSEVEQRFARLCAKLEGRHGIARERGESPKAFRQRVAKKLASTEPLLRELDQTIDSLYRSPS